MAKALGRRRLKKMRRWKVHAGVNWRTEKSQQEDKQKYAQDGGRVSTLSANIAMQVRWWMVFVPSVLSSMFQNCDRFFANSAKKKLDQKLVKFTVFWLKNREVSEDRWS